MITIKQYMILLITISLAVLSMLHDVYAEVTARPDSHNQCVQRDGLSFNGVGLWTRLPALQKLYGQPLRMEPLDKVKKSRGYGYYYYQDIKLLMFNSIVWQIEVLTPDIASKSGIRLSSSFSEVERMLGVLLTNPLSGNGNKIIHRVPICPPDPPEVEEYVVLRFDQENRLVDFSVKGVFP